MLAERRVAIDKGRATVFEEMVHLNLELLD
jgi:hypothetical protein